MAVLGWLPGHEAEISQAAAINNAGLIVGTSGTTAVLWQPEHD
jgi:hypothetical protein